MFDDGFSDHNSPQGPQSPMETNLFHKSACDCDACFHARIESGQLQKNAREAGKLSSTTSKVEGAKSLFQESPKTNGWDPNFLNEVHPWKYYGEMNEVAQPKPLLNPDYRILPLIPDSPLAKKIEDQYKSYGIPQVPKPPVPATRPIVPDVNTHGYQVSLDHNGLPYLLNLTNTSMPPISSEVTVNICKEIAKGLGEETGGTANYEISTEAALAKMVFHHACLVKNIGILAELIATIGKTASVENDVMHALFRVTSSSLSMVADMCKRNAEAHGDLASSWNKTYADAFNKFVAE